MVFQTQSTQLSKLCSILNSQNMSITLEVTSRKFCLFCFVLFLNHASSRLISRTFKFQTQIRTSEEPSDLNIQVFEKTYLLRTDRCSLHTELCLASGLPARSSSVTAELIFSAVSRLFREKQSKKLQQL